MGLSQFSSEFYITTAHKRSLGQGNIFRSVCQEFCPQGGWYPSMHCRWYLSMPCMSPGPHPRGKLRGLAWGSPGPHPGGKLRCLASGGLQAHTWGGLQAHTGWGVSRPTPGRVSRPTPGGWVSQHALRQTPPRNRRLLLQAVRILLECILVTK